MLRVLGTGLSRAGGGVHAIRQHHRPCMVPASPLQYLKTDYARSMSSESRDKLVKRKVAFVAGYNGNSYHGVQLNDSVPTVEHQLRQALFDCGAIRESNFEDLSKIDWARSSRTDKGVHAGCIVFSAKLLIDEDAIDSRTDRIPYLTEAVNARLPESIRIFSFTRVHKRFNARHNCVLRDYEYFLPLSFFQESQIDGSKVDIDEAIATFCSALRQYEGVHDFHNFTKSRSFFYRRRAKYMQESTSNEDESAEATFETQFINEEKTERKKLPRHRRAVYSCSASRIEDFCGTSYVRVHVVGQAFLLNQIRCMIGGAFALATNQMSQTAFDAALETNRVVRVPIAPPDGLVLLSCTLGGKMHAVSLLPDPNTELAKERKDLTHRVLLGKKEDNQMSKFREEVIYPEVHAAWQEADMERWRAYLERVIETNEELNESDLETALEQVREEREGKDRKRQEFAEKRRKEAAEREAKEPLMGKGGSALPRQFTTKLCVHYGVAPGIFTGDLQRAISKHFRLGYIPLEATEDEVLEYIDATGVEKLVKEGRHLRQAQQSTPMPRRNKQ